MDAALTKAATMDVRDLVKIYQGDVGVKSVSLRIDAGTVVGLLGPNGACKTTIFYIMVGLLEPDSGQVFLNGRDIVHFPAYLRARMGLGYLPQEPSIFRQLNVEENIQVALEAGRHGNGQWSVQDRLEQIVCNFQLEKIRLRRGVHLSGGQRRRVEIARLMAVDPEFVLLDEPFAGIDPKVVSETKDLILFLKGQGVGIMLSDHNARETVDICDYLYIVNDGRILSHGVPDQVLNEYRVRDIYLGQNFSI